MFQQVIFNTKLKRICLGLFLVLLMVFYKTYNPISSNIFPKCPIFSTIGIKCPGCGSQRAIHHLLNFNIANALKENVLMVLFIPYILLGFAFEMIKTPSQKLLKWRKRIFGRTAILIILFLIISFWIFRNLKLHFNW